MAQHSVNILNENLAAVYPLNILLAEDNEVNQILITKMISLLGYKIEVVENGSKVLEHLEKNRTDLIIMDIQMPKMDGLEATQRIIETYTEKERPKIVILTANAMIGDREKYLNMGADDYLFKPLRPQQIKNLIQYWGEKINAGRSEVNVSKEASPSVISLLDFQTIDINLKLGKPFFNQVKEKFYEMYRNALIKIKQFSKEKNGPYLAQVSHKLKGACGSIGAAGMRRNCMELESMGALKDFDRTDLIIRELEKNYQLTKLKLDSL